MTYLPPYRHTHRQIIAPFVDVLSDGYGQHPYSRFNDLVDALNTLVTENDGDQSPKEAYLEVIDQHKADTGALDSDDLAQGLAAAINATGVDLLGLLYQEIGRTVQDFDQYFTPPNVATGLAQMGGVNRKHFDPPAPTPDAVRGATTLQMFTNDTGSDSTTTSPSDNEPPTDAITFFDPACGSGRLLLAAARAEEDTPVVLGWELDRTAAHMTALTLALTGIPGWVIGGDAVNLATRELYRVSPYTDPPIQQFTDFQPSEAPDIISTRPADPRPFDPHEALQSPAESVTTVIGEVNRTLEAGIHQTISNPPFSTRSFDNAAPTVNRHHSEYATAHQTIGDRSTALRNSQELAWLFVDLALEFTRCDGAASLIVPTSILAKKSSKQERGWLLNTAFYESAYSLPAATFAPATTTGTTAISLIPKPPESQGVDLDYSIHMATLTDIGHDKRGEGVAYIDDDDTLDIPTDELPDYYRAHRWLDIDTVEAPDDDLRSAIRSHRDRREQSTTDK